MNCPMCGELWNDVKCGICGWYEPSHVGEDERLDTVLADLAAAPRWWRRCGDNGHETSIDDLSHRGGRYVGAVEHFCCDCSRGESKLKP
jgi:hypothetical protein